MYQKTERYKMTDNNCNFCDSLNNELLNERQRADGLSVDLIKLESKLTTLNDLIKRLKKSHARISLGVSTETEEFNKILSEVLE